MIRSHLKSTRYVLFVAVSVLLAVSVSLLISGCKRERRSKASGGESSLEMSKEALKGRLGDAELIVIDVRMAKAWADVAGEPRPPTQVDPGRRRFAAAQSRPP